MSLTKRMIERDCSLRMSARAFLLENAFAEEALNGALCSTHSSSESKIYIRAYYYYKENAFDDVFSLKEFKDEIKDMLETCIPSSAWDYDWERLD